MARSFFARLLRRLSLLGRTRSRPCRTHRRLEVLLLEDRIAPAVNQWLGAVSGTWSDASKWSDGVPTADDDVVIAATSSAYTITMNVDATVNSLNLSAANATLRIDANSTASRTLTLANGGSNAGTIILDKVDTTNATGATLAVTSGTLVNAASGVITVDAGVGFRTITAHLVNDGTVTIGASTTFTGTLENNNAVQVTAGTLSFGNASTFTQNAGTLTVQGGFSMSADTFHFHTGTLTGNTPVLTDSALHFGPGASGSGTLSMRGTGGTFSGDIPAGVTVRVDATFAASATVTAANGFTNHGTIILDKIDTTNATIATLAVTSGTLVNAADGVLTADAGVTSRAITGNLENHGVVNINASTAFNKSGAVFTNHQDVQIATGATLSFGQVSTFAQAAGSLAVAGSFSMTSGASGSDTFTFQSGNLTGNAPVLTNAALHFLPGASGAGTLSLRGVNNTFSGDIPAGVTVRIDANFAASATLTAANGFTNHGTIILDKIDTTNATIATLAVTSGTLVNAADGVLTADAGATSRVIAGNLVNDGTVNIAADTTFSKGGASFSNNHVVNGSGGSLSFVPNTTFHQNDGTLDIQGSFSMSGATFHFDQGTLTGTPLVLNNSALNFLPGANGSGTLSMRGTGGTFSGDIPAGVTVRVDATFAASATVTAANGFTNHGTIILDKIDTTNATIASFIVTSGTLVNAADGVLIADAGVTSRALSADVVNHGTVTFDINTTYTGSFTNQNLVQVNAGTLSFGNASAFTQNAGTLAVLGTFSMSADTFHFSSGTLSGTAPILLDSALSFAPGANGSGTLSMRGTASTISGDVPAGLTVRVDATFAASATVTAANGFTNHGTIILDKIDTTNATGATLAVSSGSLLNAADGLLIADAGVGFRTLAASLDNQGTLTVDTDLSLNRTGGTYGNSGSITIAAGEVLTVATGAFTQFAAGSISGGAVSISSPASFAGVGTIHTNVTNAGSMNPGLSPGILNITGTYVQTSTGMLNIELAGDDPGTGHDQLNVSAAATLAGTLNVIPVFPYCPEGSYTILTYASRSGDFGTRLGLNLGAGRSLVTTAGASQYTLTQVGPVCGTITGAPATSPEGTAITLDSSLVHTDLTYTWSVLRDGVPYSAQTGTTSAFTFTPDDNGTYEVTLQLTSAGPISHGTDTRVITVTNVAPTAVITGAPASSPEGTEITLGFDRTDPGSADTHTQTWSVTKNGSPFASGSGAAFSFTPDDDGSYVVTLTVTDDDGGVGTDSRSITITNVSPAATILGAPPSSPEGTSIALSGSVSDPGSADTHTLTWSVTRNSSPYASGTGSSFSFTPNDDGSYVVTLTATDDDGGLGSASTTITVTNVDPTATITGAPGSSPEGTTLTLTGSVTDPGSADTHTLAWSVTRDGAPYASGTGASFSFTPDDDGTYVVTLTATDDDGGVGSTSATMGVTNTAPSSVTLSGLPASALEGTPLSLNATVSDAGTGDAHTITWLVTRDGETFASGTGSSFSFTPNDDGLYEVTVTATDDEGASVTASQTLTVTNTPPSSLTLGGIAVTGSEGTSTTLSAVFNDASGDSHTFAWTVTKDGAPFASGDGATFSFTPDDDGTYVIALTVTDDDGASASTATTVTVANVAPTAEIVGAPPEGQAGVPISLSATVQDAGSADTHTVAWFVSKDGSPFASGSGVSFSFTPDTAGVYVVTVTVTDDDGASGSQSQTITVTGAAGLSIVSITASAAAISEGQSVTISGTFTHPGLGLPSATFTGTALWSDGVTTPLVLQGDGSFHTTRSFPDDNPSGSPSDAYTVAVTLSASDGASDSAVSPQVVVHNVAPVITSLGGPAVAVPGQPLLYAASFTDVGVQDTHTSTWVVRDGAHAVVASGSGLSLGYTPTRPGLYTVQFTVTDDDGGTTNEVRTLTVTFANLQTGICCEDDGPALVVGSLTVNDRIHVNPIGNKGVLQVTITDRTTDTVVYQKSFAPPAGGFHEIVIFGQGADDYIQVAGSITVPSCIHGGAGHDNIKGGGGHDILLGGPGDDLIVGGDGRDLMIGGTGADRLVGNANDDLLIAGTTAFDANAAALCAILKEWTSPRSYAQRVYNLSGGTAGSAGSFASRANGTYFLRGDEGPAQTVFNDNDFDQLTGSQGTDWFFANRSADNGGVIDQVTDQAASEWYLDEDF